ncbi:hypothetical protein S83_015483, partial [Arachis hypogaea]
WSASLESVLCYGVPKLGETAIDRERLVEVNVYNELHRVRSIYIHITSLSLFCSSRHLLVSFLTAAITESAISALLTAIYIATLISVIDFRWELAASCRLTVEMDTIKGMRDVIQTGTERVESDDGSSDDVLHTQVQKSSSSANEDKKHDACLNESMDDPETMKRPLSTAELGDGMYHPVGLGEDVIGTAQSGNIRSEHLLDSADFTRE